MFRPSLRMALLCSSAIVGSACGEQTPGDWKETVPVEGQVFVDGKPAAMLTIECVSATGLDKEHPTLSTALTDEDGNFSFGTYVSGDGVPVGTYALIFQWGTLNTFRHSYDGDKLNGRYRDAETSPVKFTAKIGEPLDLGTIELTSQ